MNEGIGGVYLVKLLMVFLVLYIIFLAFALNYAKAFRTKNSIVDYIEKYEGYNRLSKPAIANVINRLTYNVTQQTVVDYQNAAPTRFPDIEKIVCEKDLGYCIEQYRDEKGNLKARVVTFIEFNFFDMDGKFNYTAVIRYPSLNLKSEIKKYSPDDFWNDEEIG